MRLFIALPIPEPVKRQLLELQQPIQGVRWQQENQLHLTLKFLGDTEPVRAREVKAGLGDIELPSFTMRLKGFGYFPKGRHPKVLWAGISKNKELVRLQQAVEERCTELGFEAEDRSFKPHITLARLNGVKKRDVLSFVNQHKQFQIPDVPVDEFVLYESKLDPDGAKHTRLKTFPLEGGRT